MQAYDDPFATSGIVGDSWRCRLVLGSAVDRTSGEVINAGLEGDRQVVTMEVAARISAPGAAQLRCGKDESETTVDARLRDVRITAVPAGLLSLGDGTEGGTWASTGSGQPKVIHARMSQSDPIVGHDTWTPVARLPLTGGKWLMTSKHLTSFFSDGAALGRGESAGVKLFCRLRQADDVSPVSATTAADGDGVPLQLVGTVEGPSGTLRLECKWGSDVEGAARLDRVRVTAVRVR